MAGVMAVALDVMSRPWKWGEADCCTAACDVFRRLHGIDPLVPYRGAYSSEIGAHRIIRKHGGFIRLAQYLMGRAGLIEGDPRPGAVGVIRNGTGYAMAICVAPDLWAGKTITGMTTVRGAMRAWNV